MNILIVEDEAPAARRLRRLVAAEFALDPEDIMMADSLDAARLFIAEKPVDLLLLDLDLSGRDGFEILRNARPEPLATIIVSANLDRAIEAFDHDVVDFVAKPVSVERLARALDRSRNTQNSEMRLAIISQRRTDIIAVSTIIRISGAGDYAEITTEGGQPLLHDESLSVLEKRLPSSFVRVHRSHIVNMAFITRILVDERAHRVAVTSDGKEVPISRRRVRAVKKAFSEFR